MSKATAELALYFFNCVSGLVWSGLGQFLEIVFVVIVTVHFIGSPLPCVSSLCLLVCL